MAAESRTVRVRTWSIVEPAQDDSCGSGPGLTRPRLGFSPNKPQFDAGIRIEPPPSFAWATGTIPLATAAAEPPEEPPVVWSVFHGFRVGPYESGSVVIVVPNSGNSCARG